MQHLERYKVRQIKFYDVPGIGRYCEFELRFHDDYNWLISAVLEVRDKYAAVHNNKNVHQRTRLDSAFDRLMNVSMFYFDRYTLWTLLSDYAQLLLLQKQQEDGKHITTVRSQRTNTNG